MANQQNLKPFKKGYDIRRGSKPKGSKHVSSYIKEFLEDVEIGYTLLGKETLGTPIEAIIKGMIVRAIRGDLRATELLIRHGYGNSGQVREEEDKKLIIVHRRYTTTK